MRKIGYILVLFLMICSTLVLADISQDEVSIRLSEEDAAMCACDPAKYSVSIVNYNNDSLQMVLSIEGPEWLSLGWTDLMTIEPNSESSADIIAKPACNVEGNYEAKISAKSINDSEFELTKELNLKVSPKKQCMAIEFIDKNLFLKQGKEHYAIRIKNTGIIENKYRIFYDAPNWIKLKEYNINVKPNKIGEIKFNIKKPVNFTQQSLPLRIQLKAGDQAYSKIIKVYNEGAAGFSSSNINIVAGYGKKFLKYGFYLVLVVAAIGLLNWVVKFLFKNIKNILNRGKEKRKKRKETKKGKKQKKKKRTLFKVSFKDKHAAEREKRRAERKARIKSYGLSKKRK